MNPTRAALWSTVIWGGFLAFITMPAWMGIKAAALIAIGILMAAVWATTFFVFLDPPSLHHHHTNEPWKDKS